MKGEVRNVFLVWREGHWKKQSVTEDADVPTISGHFSPHVFHGVTLARVRPAQDLSQQSLICNNVTNDRAFSPSGALVCERTLRTSPTRIEAFQRKDRNNRLGGSAKRLAEAVGFEPTVGCPTHAFQACRFGRSRTPPSTSTLRLSGRLRRLRYRFEQLLVAGRCSCFERWWSDPVRPEPVNRVRTGR